MTAPSQSAWAGARLQPPQIRHLAWVGEWGLWGLNWEVSGPRAPLGPGPQNVVLPSEKPQLLSWFPPPFLLSLGTALDRSCFSLALSV